MIPQSQLTAFDRIEQRFITGRGWISEVIPMTLSYFLLNQSRYKTTSYVRIVGKGDFTLSEVRQVNPHNPNHPTMKTIQLDYITSSTPVEKTGALTINLADNQTTGHWKTEASDGITVKDEGIASGSAANGAKGKLGASTNRTLKVQATKAGVLILRFVTMSGSVGCTHKITFR